MSEQFEKWWYEVGSGMPPARDESAFFHAERVAKAAWEKCEESLSADLSQADNRIEEADLLISSLKADLSEARLEVGRIKDAIPTNWLDPLLTGPNAVIGEPPYTGLDIERLLQAIKKRIEHPTPGDGHD
jgi:hypothetical protein